MHGLTVGPRAKTSAGRLQTGPTPKVIEVRSSEPLTHSVDLGSKVLSWHALALCVRSFRCRLRPLLQTPCSRGWLNHDGLCPLCRPVPVAALRYRHIQYIRGTQLYAHPKEDPNTSMSMYLQMLATIQTSMRSAWKCPGRKVRNTIADMPETKKKRNSLVSSNPPASIGER